MHWMMEFFIPLDRKYIKLARELLKFPIYHKPNFHSYYTNDDNGYILKNVYVNGFSSNMKKRGNRTVDAGAVFFTTESGLIRVGESYYPPLHFSIPKTNLLEYETEDELVVQDIKVTEWAFDNCFMLAVNKIYERWGKMMVELINDYHSDNWNNTPMCLYSPYRALIEEQQKYEMRKLINEYKKQKGGDLMEDPKNNKELDNQERSKEDAEPKNLFVFYTDGSGNWASDQKYKDKGHYSVYLKSTDEKWKRKEDKITSNQSELKGLISALYIACKRCYEDVEIRVDSQNAIKWYLGRDDTLRTNIEKESKNIWESKDIEISKLVDKMVELGNKIKNLSIIWISRDKNYAHAI